MRPAFSFGEERSYFAFPWLLSLRMWLCRRALARGKRPARRRAAQPATRPACAAGKPVRSWKVPAVLFFGVPWLPFKLPNPEIDMCVGA